MVKRLLFCIAVLCCLMNTQCEDDVIIDTECDFTTIVSDSKYAVASHNGLSFIEAIINDDCLTLKIGASGCDGSTWQFELIDSGAVAESLPEQRYLKLDFDNEELCDAYFERTFSFDLTPVQVQGSNKIILHIEGLENALTYSY
ncbi:hypothetical protein [Seonamhaeicola marinus]|uniref:Uncharacterized protein n=1 Tax=Seonamhaeicola marinus TaxID=1912246 RepID=A0A5D0HWJ3_9FLAO|nr:hypothetical protein [Seonamhaeicola marinus]TYA74889.1 hypothetical protein FUA24_16430 [Seonamhaeicola marinus]